MRGRRWPAPLLAVPGGEQGESLHERRLSGAGKRRPRLLQVRRSVRGEPATGVSEPEEALAALVTRDRALALVNTAIDELGKLPPSAHQDALRALALFEELMPQLPDLRYLVTVGEEDLWHDDRIFQFAK